MNYTIINIALLSLSMNTALSVLNCTKDPVQKQQKDSDERQCICYCKKVLELLKNSNTMDSAKLSIQEQELIVNAVCGQDKKTETSIPEKNMRYWLMHSALLD